MKISKFMMVCLLKQIKPYSKLNSYNYNETISFITLV